MTRAGRKATRSAPRALSGRVHHLERVGDREEAIPVIHQEPDLICAHLERPASIPVERCGSDQRGALVVRGLDSAPAGQTYQIWYLQNGADPVAGPTFAVTAQGDAVVPLTANVVTFNGVAISLEPESGSDRPTTPLLLQGLLGGAAG